jgi:hypothetical protein
MTLTIPLKRYPAGPVTPHGTYYLRTGMHPVVQLRSYDETIAWDMMGGRVIADRAMPECALIKSNGLKGLIPPWRTIDQKGATEDGIHFVDALYDPIEISMEVSLRARNGTYLRQLSRDLIASIDAKRTSELWWFTQEQGKWWSDIRWFKTPPDAFTPSGQMTRQDLTLILRGDNGFWRTFNSVDSLTATGFVQLTNPGDQPMFPRYTCFGPGTFKFADGPGSTQMVEFGPLLPGQVAQIRTDPRRRGVVDLTQKPPSTQEESQWEKAMKDLKSFTQVLSVFQSIFGLLGTGPVPPQGNMYSLLKGRFSDNSAIPAKSPGTPAMTRAVRVEITGGDVNTRVIAAGTPLRRLPY